MQASDTSIPNPTATSEETFFIIKERPGGVIEIKFQGATPLYNVSTQAAIDFQRTMNRFLNQYGNNEALVLVELADDEGIVSKEALSIYQQLMNDNRIMRIAIYGGLETYRKIAQSLLPITKRSVIKIFPTKSQAMRWLSET